MNWCRNLVLSCLSFVALALPTAHAESKVAIKDLVLTKEKVTRNTSESYGWTPYNREGVIRESEKMIEELDALIDLANDHDQEDLNTHSETVKEKYEEILEKARDGEKLKKLGKLWKKTDDDVDKLANSPDTDDEDAKEAIDEKVDEVVDIHLTTKACIEKDDKCDEEEEDDDDESEEEDEDDEEDEDEDEEDDHEDEEDDHEDEEDDSHTSHKIKSKYKHHSHQSSHSSHYKNKHCKHHKHHHCKKKKKKKHCKHKKHCKKKKKKKHCKHKKHCKKVKKPHKPHKHKHKHKVKKKQKKKKKVKKHHKRKVKKHHKHKKRHKKSVKKSHKKKRGSIKRGQKKRGSKKRGSMKRGKKRGGHKKRGGGKRRGGRKRGGKRRAPVEIHDGLVVADSQAENSTVKRSHAFNYQAKSIDSELELPMPKIDLR